MAGKDDRGMRATGGGWGAEKEGVFADDEKDMEKSFSSPIRLRE